jgi:hypothetical protein
MVHQIPEHGEGFGAEGNLHRLTPEPLIARIKAKRGKVYERRTHIPTLWQTGGQFPGKWRRNFTIFPGLPPTDFLPSSHRKDAIATFSQRGGENYDGIRKKKRLEWLARQD